MAIPSLVLTPQESRSRYGKVTPELHGAVEQTERGWKLWRGLEDTSMLATQGRVLVHGEPVEPEVVGAGPIMVDSPYGPAWAVTGSDGLRVNVANIMQAKEGTILWRARFRENGTRNQYPAYLLTATGGLVLGYGRRGSDKWHLLTAGNGRGISTLIENGVWLDGGIRVFPYASVPDYAGWEYRLYPTDGTNTGGSFPIGRNLAETGRVMIGGDNNVAELDIAGVAIWDHDIGHAETERILRTMPVWGPTGTITVPHPQPVGDLLVRYRESGKERSMRLHGPGRFGSSGIVRWEDGQLTITTDRELELLGLIAYPAEASVSVHGMAARAGEIATQGYAEPEGDALVLWEGTTNHVGNPDIEGGSISGIGQTNAGQSLTATQEDAWEGEWSARLDGDGTQNSVGVMMGTTDFTASAGQPITTSIYIKAPAGKSIAHNIFSRDTDGESYYPGVTHNDVATGDWQRLVVNATLARDIVYATPRVQVRQGGEPTTFYADGGQVELKPYATPFTVGTREDGAITIPLRETPRRITVVYREEDGSDALATLTGSGTFGQYGRAELDGTTLTITTDRQTEILAVVVDNVLTDDEATRLMQTDVWRWNSIVDLPAGVISREVDVGLAVAAHTVEVPIVITPGRVKHG